MDILRIVLFIALCVFYAFLYLHALSASTHERRKNERASSLATMLMCHLSVVFVCMCPIHAFLDEDETLPAIVVDFVLIYLTSWAIFHAYELHCHAEDEKNGVDDSRESWGCAPFVFFVFSAMFVGIGWMALVHFL